MFTGIITAIGTVQEIDRYHSGDAHFSIETPHDFLGDCQAIPLGASIACNGICLTVAQTHANSFTAQISLETMAKTTAQFWQIGESINLERSLALGDELGGHFVFGHIDGVGQIISIAQDGSGWRVQVEAPDTLAHLIAPKGSIAVDGIALTINEVQNNRFGVMIIPHTHAHTTLGQRQPGDKINLEADMLARYVARILQQRGV